MTRRKNELLASALVVGVLGAVVGLGVFGLFSGTTENAGNEISTGTVLLSDNDAGQALFPITDAKPGESWTRCIKITYNGSQTADVRSYLQSTPGPLSQYLHLKLERGTQATSTFPDCTGFTPAPTGAVLFDGDMTTLTARDWDTGVEEDPVGASNWGPGDSVVLQVTMALSPGTPNTLQNASTGSATIVWEARNSS